MVAILLCRPVDLRRVLEASQACRCLDLLGKRYRLHPRLTGVVQQGMAPEVVLSKEPPRRPFPEFTGRVLKSSPESWRYGVTMAEKKWLGDLVNAIRLLRHQGVMGAGVTSA